jgi:hypothetical protein
MLYGDRAALPLLTPTWDKRYLPLGEGDIAFCREPLPLRTLFILGPRQDLDAPRIESVTTAEAFIYLVGNTYRNLLLDQEQRTQEFRFLHRLLEAVPVQRVFAHKDPARIGELLDLILDASAEAPRV